MSGDGIARSESFTSADVPARYQELLAPVVFEPWARRLLQAAAVPPGAAVLDLACGTGVVSRRAAAAAGTTGAVTAVDLSATMLAEARIRAAEAGAAAITYVEASALELPLPDDAFDRVLIQQGLQFFPDRPAALAETRRVLAPGGTITLAVWSRAHRLEPFLAFGEALTAIGATPPFPGAFGPDAVTMEANEITQLLTGAGFTGVTLTTAQLDVTFPDHATAALAIEGTPFGPLVAALAPEQRAALDADLRERFADLTRTSTSLVATGTA